MTTVTQKKVPSWFMQQQQQQQSDDDDESVVDRKQLQREQIEDVQLLSSCNIHEQEKSSVSECNSNNNTILDKDQDNVKDENDDDDDDDSDDTDEGRNRGAMLPANLQVKESPKRTGILFGIGRRGGYSDNASSVDRGEESGSVATRSYMRGFSGNTVHSSATASSILSVLSRLIPFGFNNKKDTTDTDNEQKKSSRPPLPPKKKGALAPSKKDSRKKSNRHRVVATSTSQQHDEHTESNVHSSLPDPSPTHKSISTMDTEEATLEGGVPSVIYCFIKANPHDDDVDGEDELNGSSTGVLAYLPKSIAKRLPKRKQPKLFIDEDDEESYFQTLIAL